MYVFLHLYTCWYLHSSYIGYDKCEWEKNLLLSLSFLTLLLVAIAAKSSTHPSGYPWAWEPLYDTFIFELELYVGYGWWMLWVELNFICFGEKIHMKSMWFEMNMCSMCWFEQFVMWSIWCMWVVNGVCAMCEWIYVICMLFV